MWTSWAEFPARAILRKESGCTVLPIPIPWNRFGRRSRSPRTIVSSVGIIFRGNRRQRNTIDHVRGSPPSPYDSDSLSKRYLRWLGHRLLDIPQACLHCLFLAALISSSLWNLDKQYRPTMISLPCFLSSPAFRSPLCSVRGHPPTCWQSLSFRRNRSHTTPFP